MKKITAFITFQADSNVVKKGDSCIIELPDFKEYEPDYTETIRKQIRTLWAQVANSNCSVVFDFEMPNMIVSKTAEQLQTDERRTMQFFNNREQRNINQ